MNWIFHTHMSLIYIYLHATKADKWQLPPMSEARGEYQNLAPVILMCTVLPILGKKCWNSIVGLHFGHVNHLQGILFSFAVDF